MTLGGALLQPLQGHGRLLSVVLSPCLLILDLLLLFFLSRTDQFHFRRGPRCLGILRQKRVDANDRKLSGHLPVLVIEAFFLDL